MNFLFLRIRQAHNYNIISDIEDVVAGGCGISNFNVDLQSLHLDSVG